MRLSLPDSIQWAPPGTHEVNCTKGGNPVALKIIVTESGAQRVAERFAVFSGQAAAGAEDIPYIDFNHNDEEAAGHVVSVWWGGSHPAKGGIRAKIEWTEPGKRAVLERTYRRFSPSFFVDDNGNITGAPLNMGGLVNRAAFKRIQPILPEDQVIAASETDPSASMFVTLFEAKCREGFGKTAALDWVIARHGGAYLAWRQAGCNPVLA